MSDEKNTTLHIRPSADVLDLLIAAVDLPPEVNRAFDIAGPDVLTYREMIERFAERTGLRPRKIVTVPVLTPMLAGKTERKSLAFQPDEYDMLSTGSINRSDNGKRYTIRRSVLQKTPGSVCIVDGYGADGC